MMLACLGHAYAAAGEPREAEKILDQLTTLSRHGYVSPIHPALVAIGLESDEVALTELERACQDRSGWLVFLGVDPRFERLRGRARFSKLLEQIGLRGHFEQVSGKGAA